VPVRIVILDDVAENATLLERFAAQIHDAEVISFTDPVVALAWCEANEPDLLFLDYVMPQYSGVEVLTRLRRMAHFVEVPVIVVTAADDRETRLKALDAGANDFVAKPFESVELLARSQSMLRLRAASRELRRLATTDDLTGLQNRRSFLARLADEVRRATRYRERSLSLAIFDVDHFKRVNDAHGSAAGDLVLKRIADICRSTTRGMDIAGRLDVTGRLGGEEFGVLMPETDRAGGFLCCERLRQSIQAASVQYGGMPVNVTVSLGLAEHAIGDDPDGLVARADEALNRAKAAGRNQTCI